MRKNSAAMYKTYLPSRWCLLILSLSALCHLSLCNLSVQAALDPETRTPYRFQVVLHIAKHRLLTEEFKDEIERQLRDWLQDDLGDMAQVEVLRQHPRLDEIEKSGLQALDGWKEV